MPNVFNFTLSKVTINRIQAFEIRIYRRILKISSCDHTYIYITVSERTNKDLELVTTVKTRKTLKHLGRLMRHPRKYSLPTTVHNPKQNNRKKEPWKSSNLFNLRKRFNTSTSYRFRAALNRDQVPNYTYNQTFA